jgi:hypothetical protein
MVQELGFGPRQGQEIFLPDIAAITAVGSINVICQRYRFVSPGVKRSWLLYASTQYINIIGVNRTLTIHPYLEPRL